ncbi:reverse transcriptase [Phytophthora palmivora]|uniref:RNA-directed DNA polymerase n=1 Tax=Phytophthora palmivora TaxID=4796 RepID=A0A2P4X2J8_9STRA|nr:reverse transcriptase [Phytophthora palmivora]
MCSRPELRKVQDKPQQCMTTLTQKSAVPSRNSGNKLPEISENTDPIPDDTVSFRLKDGECYGWWEDNYPDRSKRDVVMVHGAVNDRRTKILLDTGATINILSYDFARKLGLRLKSHKQTKVSGMGGVPTYIGASAEIKLTLGPRVVYIVDVWVANIGEGIDVLLGMGFMFAAGVRVSTREGMVSLPNEVVVMMCNWEPGDHIGRSRIDYGPTNPQREVVWAGRGDRWVTQLIYAARSWPVAVRVVNISDKNTWVNELSDVARIVEYGFFPRHGRFVRPGSGAYRDSEVLILESTPSPETKKRMEREARLEALMPQPPCVEPTKILQRPRLDIARVQFVKSDPTPVTKRVRFALDASTQTDDCCSGVADSLDATRVSRKRCMQVSNEELDLEPGVYMREGKELLAQLRDQLVMLPELEELTPECDIDSADVGEPGKTIPEMEKKLRDILKYHRKIFLGDGNAAPAPARGVVCDLDVGDAKPVAQRPRSVAPHLMLKVYELLTKLLETGLIEYSNSPWASPIVIVLKKNGVDIRMCIDYRIVNGFIQLSPYPLPLIDDLMIGFETAIMPFGLKNAPLVYQAMLDNCLWGFVRLSPEEEAEVDADVLEFLQLKPQDSENQSSDFGNHALKSEMSALTSLMTVFQRNIPVPTYMGPFLGRNPYIDDIAHGAPTWDQLFQSFMGSLNYYNKFIEDLPVIAATLYELTDEQIRSGKDLTCAKEAFELLKRKIVSTPLLRYPDRTRPFVIIPHANPWAASAVLGQKYDGVIHPVRFTGRVLNDAELRYHIVEKEVIAILRVLENFRALVESSPVIVVYTRYSVLKWLLTSNSTDGRNVKWGLKLSHWDLEIRRIQRDEDGLPAILGEGITPREHLDEVSENLIPAKGESNRQLMSVWKCWKRIIGVMS